MKLRPMKHRELVKILKDSGYERDPKHDVRGSHEMWWNPDTKRAFPLPTYKEFGVSLLKKVIKESGIPRSEFV